jgi:hypothetical protein
MTDYFAKLAARTLGLAPVVRPVVASPFEAEALPESLVEAEATPAVKLVEQIPDRTPSPPARTPVEPEVAQPVRAPVTTEHHHQVETRFHEVQTIETAQPARESVSMPAPLVPPAPAPQSVPAAVVRESETIVEHHERSHELYRERLTETHIVHETTAPSSLPPVERSTIQQALPLESRVAATPARIPERRAALRQATQPRRHATRDETPAPVHVTIGRVEVRTAPPPAPPRAPERRTLPSPKLPLDRYLEEQG